MNRFVPVMTCLSAAASLAYAEEAHEKANAATATVSGGKCVFNFPIDDIERQWRWGVSPANYCEYCWMVTVKRGDALYQIGFSYFNPDSVPESGSLVELLATGQSDLWKLLADGQGASVIEGVRVTCHPTPKSLRIVIDNRKWTAELFGDTPKSVTFETGGTQLKSNKTVVNVNYVPASKKSDR